MYNVASPNESNRRINGDEGTVTNSHCAHLPRRQKRQSYHRRSKTNRPESEPDSNSDSVPASLEIDPISSPTIHALEVLPLGSYTSPPRARWRRHVHALSNCPWWASNSMAGRRKRRSSSSCSSHSSPPPPASRAWHRENPPSKRQRRGNLALPIRVDDIPA